MKASIIIVVFASLILGIPAEAGDLGKCSQKDVAGSWRIFITFRPQQLGVVPEYRCDVTVSKSGKISGKFCQKAYDTKQLPEASVSGVARVSNKCIVKADIVIKRKGSWPEEESIVFSGPVSRDRSRILGDYTSSVQPISDDTFGRIEWARMP